jgi:hypothetical protein
VNCIHLFQDTVQWLALVNTVRIRWVPQNVVNFFILAERLSASQEGLWSIEPVSWLDMQI